MSGQPGFLQKALDSAYERARHFWATAEAVIRGPQLFFVRYFAAAGIDHPSVPPEGKADSFPYMKPFAFLGYAIGISAFLLPLTQFAMLDLVQDSQMLSPGFGDMLREMRGRPMSGIDFNALAGIPFLDSALAGAARYAAYFLFAMLFSSMAQRQLTVEAGAHCFAYLVAVALLAGAAFQIIAALLQLTVGLGLQGYMALDFLAETAIAAYVLGMPSLVLPAALKVERPVVRKATLWALGIWFVAQLFFQLIQVAIGIPIRNFGLGLLGFL